MATGIGLIPVRKADGGVLRVRTYYVPSTDSTALFLGDPVELDSSGALDPLGQVPVVTRGVAEHVLVGAVVGFLPDPNLPYTGHYRPASTNRYVLVCDDPDAIFQVQEDAVGGSVAATDIARFYNADIIVASGSTVTGLSGVMLDSNTAAATTAQLKIVGVARDQVNAGAQSGGAVLEVLIFEHAFRTADSVS